MRFRIAVSAASALALNATTARAADEEGSAWIAHATVLSGPGASVNGITAYGSGGRLFRLSHDWRLAIEGGLGYVHHSRSTTVMAEGASLALTTLPPGSVIPTTEALKGTGIRAEAVVRWYPWSFAFAGVGPVAGMVFGKYTSNACSNVSVSKPSAGGAAVVGVKPLRAVGAEVGFRTEMLVWHPVRECEDGNLDTKTLVFGPPREFWRDNGSLFWGGFVGWSW